MQKAKGVISGLDFEGTPKPNGKLRSANLYDGTGPVVKKGQTIFARYLGEVYKGKKPFDQNFDQASPATFQIGAGKVITGWDKTLVGQHVGSEVILAIPPKDGYGKKGYVPGRHQGHRHAVLRGRHRRGRLSRMCGMSSRSPRPCPR